MQNQHHTTPNLGQTPTSAHQRDAIHIAVLPMVSDEILDPGQSVALHDGKAVALRIGQKPVGVVDPFRAESILPGTTFWLMLYPQTITSLRHEWTHPAFPMAVSQNSDTSFSEMWLRVYAKKMNCYDDEQKAYERLIEGIKSKQIYAYGSDLHGLYELEDADELAAHATVVLGYPIKWDDDYTFTCSC